VIPRPTAMPTTRGLGRMDTVQGYVPQALVAGRAGVFALLFLGSAELLLNRKLSLPVSRMWQ